MPWGAHNFIAHITSYLQNEMTNTNILSRINGFDRRTKIFYVSTVALSLGLVVFGACVFLLSDTSKASSELESLAFEDPFKYEKSDETDETKRATFPTTVSPTLPAIVLRPSHSESLRASVKPSTYLSSNPSEVSSSTPSLSVIPSVVHSSSPSTSTSPSYNPSDSPSTTSAPSEMPSFSPSYPPSDSPSISIAPSFKPSAPPTSSAPTLSSSPTLSGSPSDVPLFPSNEEPYLPDPSYFNYDVDSEYGPKSWENVTVNSTDNYWYKIGFDENLCGSNAQSPIDLCTEPTRQCMEAHEFRSRPGDYTIEGNFTDKKILPNMLRVVMARRQGEEPDPPHTDFSAIGYRALDMLNIDIKFPSEHTLCGRAFDGEMQYFFFHPVRKVLIGIAWLFEAEADATNYHMQQLIDEFQHIYDANDVACKHTLNNPILIETSQNTTTEAMSTHGPEKLVQSLLSGYHGRGLKKTKPWDPFHSDIQKTVHFWGYSGSLTEPPCSSVLWRIMDVTVKISPEQLHQLQNILFNNREPDTCDYTSVHFNGRVNRPVSPALRYYKCTRSDYVSDDERDLCGDGGCDVPFGKDLEPYVEPEIYVTGPPTQAPVN